MNKYFMFARSLVQNTNHEKYWKIRSELEQEKVGNNVKVGANCVVFSHIPDNCTVVLPKPRVILRDNIKTRLE